MVLPRRGIPHDSGFWNSVEAARLTYQLRGVMWRVIVELEKTPKPWPDNVRKARNAALKAQTMTKEYWDAFPQEIRHEAVPPPPSDTVA